MPNLDKTHFRDQVLSRLNQVAPVTARSMFGGYGLYSEGVMFALIAYSQLYFKADDTNRPDFLSANMPPFTYSRQGKEYVMSYYRLPDPVYHDVAQLADWVNKALTAARRAKRKKARKAEFS